MAGLVATATVVGKRGGSAWSAGGGSVAGGSGSGGAVPGPVVSDPGAGGADRSTAAAAPAPRPARRPAATVAAETTISTNTAPRAGHRRRTVPSLPAVPPDASPRVTVRDENGPQGPPPGREPAR